MNPHCESFYIGATEELKDKKGASALKSVQRIAQSQFDESFSIELAASGRRLACRDGCSFCCYMKVDVQAQEVFLIVDYMRAKFSKAQIDEVKAAASANFEKIAVMTEKQHLGTNLKCPLLRDGSCSVYPVRPLACRQHHSTDVKICEGSYNNSADIDSPGGEISELKLAASGAVVGVGAAFANSGYDGRAYDLNGALIGALENAKSERRWADGKNAFGSRYVAKGAEMSLFDLLREKFQKRARS